MCDVRFGYSIGGGFRQPVVSGLAPGGVQGSDECFVVGVGRPLPYRQPGIGDDASGLAACDADTGIGHGRGAAAVNGDGADVPVELDGAVRAMRSGLSQLWCAGQRLCRTQGRRR